MIGAQIRTARKAQHLIQEELAERAGIAREQISRYESGKVTPDTDTVIKIANALDLPLRYFLDDLEFDGNTLESSSDYSSDAIQTVPINRKVVPIVGEIACGTPITAEQNIVDYADLPDGVRADFALVCKGDSMEPTFSDGDIVLIRQQSNVEDGQIAVVLIEGEATLKHVYHQETGLLLTADNPKYAPIYLQPTEFQRISIQGKAVGYTRMFQD